jgi:orotidine-5'-phosphate decarboxylase
VCLGDEDLKDIGISDSIPVQVGRLARLAIVAGCHGVVASPEEPALLMRILPVGALIVTPGIQLSGPAKNRSASPEAAIRSGARLCRKIHHGMRANSIRLSSALCQLCFLKDLQRELTRQ